MDAVWTRMFDAARKVQNGRKISDYVEAGGVAAAILSASGKIYTGVCVDTCSTLGICAERNAIFNMLTNGEQEIAKVLAIMPRTAFRSCLKTSISSIGIDLTSQPLSSMSPRQIHHSGVSSPRVTIRSAS